MQLIITQLGKWYQHWRFHGQEALHTNFLVSGIIISAKP